MKPQRWQHIDRIFADALECPPAERPALLDEACAGDAEARREVEQLLQAEEKAQSFLQDPLSRRAVARTLNEALPAAEGERFGAYQLLRRIGHGGMSTVYLACRDDDEYQQQVAVKLIRRGFESPEILHRFRTERQILARLEHPSIARLYDGGTAEDGRPFLVMEYVEGLSIDEYCDRHRLSVAQRLELFCEVCAAVHHAHQNLLVHRDLKPGNILVTGDGQAKLLDFGIAKPLDAEPSDATRTGVRPMTPEYASPEQIRQEAITTATDTYALGVLLYRLLAGRHPYRLREDLPHELERAILEQEPERPSDAVVRPEAAAQESPEDLSRARSTTPQELRKRLRGDLDTIVLRALAKRPERRYRSAQELSDDIRRHLADRPVTARPDTLGYRFGKFVRRNTLAVVAGGVLAVVLLGFSLVTRLQSARIAEERDVARLERARAQQISSFLMELFEVSDPDTTKGAELTVREVLDRSAAKLEELEDQPELQATYMDTIGTMYRRLGLYDAAAGLLEKALGVRRRLHGDKHEEVTNTVDQLAGLLQDKGDYEAAEPLFREVLATRRELFGEEHTGVAESLNNLGLLLYFKGDYEESEALFRESLAMAYKLFGDKHFAIATITNNLALVLHEKGDYEAAEPIYRETLALRRELHGDEHTTVAVSLNNLAALLYDQEDFEAAEPFFRQALAMRRKLLGDEHPMVALSLNNLALLLYDQGDYETAETLYRQALAMGRKLLGDEHPRVATTLTGLARLLLARGRSSDAEQLAREALAVYRKKLPPGHIRTAYAETVLGGCLNDPDRQQEAEALLTGSYSVLESKLNEREPMTRDSLGLLIEHYERRGMPGKAAEYRALRTGNR